MDYNCPSFMENEVLDFLETYPFPVRNVEGYVDVETGEHRVEFEFENWFGDWVPADRSLDEE